MYKGKAIYNPKGAAGEYAKWACNFYVGCSNDCSYCYCKKGVLAHAMGGKTATLKKCFKDEEDALNVFIDEMLKNIDALIEHGIFFTFTSDPMLPETIKLTMSAINALVVNEIPVKILTKCAAWVDPFLSKNGPIVCFGKAVHRVAFGFTLTGHDELEPGASTNSERIHAMKKLHDAGFKTFASIEPIIDFQSSMNMIYESSNYCDLYKIGLESGKKYDETELINFKCWTNKYLSIYSNAKIYWKDSISNITGFSTCNNCVSRDYNIFLNQ